MKFIINRKYIDGPLDGEIIAFNDWPDNVNHRIVEINGEKHLYSRRSRWNPNSPDKDKPFWGECAVRYLGTWADCLKQQYERALPYNVFAKVDLHEKAAFAALSKDLIEHVRVFHPGVPILLEINRDFPLYTVTQVVHSKTPDTEINDFMQFARDLRWDAKHDDVQNQRMGVFT